MNALQRYGHRQYWLGLICGAALLVAAVCLAETLTCSVCGKAISGQYLRANDRVFCSRTCFEKTLPRCAECGKTITGQHYSLNDKPYCSRACTEKQMPHCEVCGAALSRAFEIDGHVYCQRHAEAERCTRCGLPYIKGIKLPDGRLICDDCNHDLVTRHQDALKLLVKAQQEVAAVTGYRSDSLPQLLLVGLDRLCKENHIKPREGMLQRGLYNRQVTTVTGRNLLGKVTSRKTIINERVFILYGLGPDEFLATASHELTHDLLAETFPAIPENAPLWFEEGICQYVAAMVSHRNGNDHVLDEIKRNPDSAYGDGYRYFVRMVGETNWAELVALIRRTDLADLPDEPPTEGE